jgi:hypothetical protein
MTLTTYRNLLLTRAGGGEYTVRPPFAPGCWGAGSRVDMSASYA